MDVFFAPLLSAAIAGAVSGLVAWGGMRAEVRVLRRHVDALHGRVDALMLALVDRGMMYGKSVSPLGRLHERNE